MTKLDFEVNYGYITIVIFGKEFDECIEWNGYIKDIDECCYISECSDNPGYVINKIIERVNEYYSEFIDKSPMEMEREIYGCGPEDIRFREEF